LSLGRQGDLFASPTARLRPMTSGRTSGSFRKYWSDVNCTRALTMRVGDERVDSVAEVLCLLQLLKDVVFATVAMTHRAK
jgi:hypothetical protein